MRDTHSLCAARMMWAQERPSHAPCPFKLKGWTAFEHPTKSDGDATGRCYAIYCCPLRLIRLMRQRPSPPPTTSPPPSLLPSPPPAMATFPALSAKRESEVMYKSSRGQFTPDLTWQSWRADCAGAHSHSHPPPFSPPPPHSCFADGPDVDDDA